MSGPVEWQKIGWDLKSKVGELREALGYYVDAITKFTEVRDVIGKLKHELKRDNPKFRYYAFEILHDALIFTPVDKLEPTKLATFCAMIDRSTKELVEPDDCREIREILSKAGFEQAPK